MLNPGVDTIGGGAIGEMSPKSKKIGW